MKLKNKDLLTLDELNPNDLSKIIDLAIKLKKNLKTGSSKPILKHKTLAMIFQNPRLEHELVLKQACIS